MFRNLFGVRLPRLALHTLLLALPFAAILAEPALAQNLDPLENILQTVVDALTGPIGRLIAILAVVAAGYMMFTGRLNWPLFLAIFFGVVLLMIPGASAAPVIALMNGLNDVFMTMVDVVMKAAPWFVFALMAGVVSRIAGNDLGAVIELFKSLAGYSITVILGLAIVVFVILSLIHI